MLALTRAVSFVQGDHGRRRRLRRRMKKGLVEWDSDGRAIVIAHEEHLHALKIFDYVLERGGRIKLLAVEAPPQDWDSPLMAFKDALEHEQDMTAKITELADLALQERDHATNNVMQWYVSEQVEEEANVDDIVKKLEMVGDNGPGMFMMDRELKARPAPAAIPGTE